MLSSQGKCAQRVSAQHVKERCVASTYWQSMLCLVCTVIHENVSADTSSRCCRVKAYHQRSAQYDQILKKNEQMYALLAIATSLCPASQRNIDESDANTLKEK